MKQLTPELTNMQRKAFRFALRLKPGQEKSLNRWTSHQRWIWNQALARQRKNHENGEKYSSYETMSGWVTSWKADEQTSWLNDGPSQPLQQTLKALDKALHASSKRARLVDEKWEHLALKSEEMIQAFASPLGIKSKLTGQDLTRLWPRVQGPMIRDRSAQ